MCSYSVEIKSYQVVRKYLKYNTLQMFNLENVPYHLLQLDSGSLCVASKRANCSSELLKLKLPIKLTLPPEEEGLSKENDFKLLSGIFIDNEIYQMGKFDDLVLTSEINVTGLQIYSFTENALDNKNKVQKLDIVPWINPDFAVMQDAPHLICSKCCHQPVIQIDGSANKKLKDIKHPFYTLDVFSELQSEKNDPCILNNIKCNALSPNLIAILGVQSGEVFLHDLRTSNTFTSLLKMSEGSSEEIWTLSGCNFKESSLNYFGILSNTTSFCIYDIRKNGVLCQRKGENPPVENFMKMKLKFSEKEEKFSISGMNSTVEIFKFSENNFESVFTHYGHCPKTSSSVFVTDHIWLQGNSKEYIASVCDNKTLNCWN